MRIIRYLSGYILLLALVYGCVFPYEIDFKGTDDILVINGHLTDREGYHYIEISRTSPLKYPDRYTPVFNCLVAIQDDKGNVFTAIEKGHGKYACWIDGEYLTIGSQFQLTVTTPDGRNYVSEYDELLACPPIDEVHWNVEEIPSDDPDSPHIGVQFYVTTDASGDYAEEYRWDLIETWEYRTTYMLKAYYDGRIRELAEKSDSLHICYITGRVGNDYIYTTRMLESGHIRRLPLNYVSNQSDRLSERYSLLVRQMSLSPAAYNFWSILEERYNQSGDLYETQPLQIRGNIHSVDDPEEIALGFFYTSSIQEKRVFVRVHMHTLLPGCGPWGLEGEELEMEMKFQLRRNYPVWLLEVSPGKYDIVHQECFDCRLRGGTLQKPDNWE